MSVERIGQAIARARSARAMSLRAVALAAGVSYQTVFKAERGGRVSLGNVRRIARATGISMRRCCKLMALDVMTMVRSA